MSSSNSEVIELLQLYLEHAKRYNFTFVSIAMVKHGDPKESEDTRRPIGATDFAGEIGLEEQGLEAVGLLKQKLEKSIDNWSLPHPDLGLGADHVVYNVARDPLGFDFVVWLIIQEMARRREGAPAPLRVAFFTGKYGELTADRLAWINNVFRPALALVGAIEDPAALRGRHRHSFTTGEIVKLWHAGEQVPLLRAPRKMKHDRPPVTITLREADHWPHRNSNLEGWLAFAAWLKQRGEVVVFVRDTAKAPEPLPDGSLTYPPASRDLQTRMALYTSAKVNLFVSNGPATLAQFSAVPWLMFTAVEDPNAPDAFIPNTPDHLDKSMGIPVGAQFPWSAPQQRIIWAADTYDAIVEAWLEHIEPTKTGDGQDVLHHDSHAG